jgi:peptidoglycan/xylan/chitin deacetylase (PgdA/CDA1 family)
MPLSTLTRALLWTSYRAGGPVLRDWLRGANAKILMYHGVSSAVRHDIRNRHGYTVAVRDFEQQLSYLHRRCHVVSLADLYSGRNLSRRHTNVVLSFDDGYENNYTAVFPLLARYRMAALFALPTAFVCGRQPLWNDAVEHVVARSTRRSVRFEWEGCERTFDLTATSGRGAAYDWLIEQCVGVAQHRRPALIEMAAASLAVAPQADEMFRDDDYRPLTTAQIAEMTRSDLVEWASHSVHHYLLSKVDRETARVELCESRRQIEALTGRRCSTLCLPGGSHTDEILREASEAGYQLVLTSNRGGAVVGGRVQNRMVVMNHYSIEFFADVVHGPVLRGLLAVRRLRARAAARLPARAERPHAPQPAGASPERSRTQ